MKKVVIGLLLVGLTLMLASPVVSAKSDKDKPTQATDIELVKKVTLKSPQARGGKTAPQAATGILGSQCSGTKYAIIIGISDYPGTANDLEYGDDDAVEVKNTLINVYHYDANNIRLLTNMDASWTAIKGAIDTTRSLADPNDEVVFFFSGHGAKGKADDGDRETIDEAIVSHDGNQDGNFVYIWDGDLKNLFDGFPTSRITFIFDSCLAGGMDDLKSIGRVICMACSESGLSYEGTQWGGGHGQFTYYFIQEGMASHLADKYDNLQVAGPDVTVEEAFDYAKVHCVYQAPTISDSFTNDLLLGY
jgi:metacaspase-1